MQATQLAELPPELIHKIALTGYLTPPQVAALSQTCHQMASILVWDEYGNNIHHALNGVLPNVKAQRWKAAQYAAHRGWFVDDREDGEGVWKEVAKAVVGHEKIDLDADDNLTGWEDVMITSLSLPAARGWRESWKYMDCGCWFKTSILHIAAHRGSERVVDWVAERGGNLEVRNQWRETPLFVASKAGRLGMVRKLVDAGADLMTRSTVSECVLHAACQSGRVDLLRYLLGLGLLDVDEEDEKGGTPLGDACYRGNLDVVTLLVEEGGADVNKADGEGRTPLFGACWKGWEDIVRYLLQVGVDPRVVNHGGYTPLDVAQRWNHDTIVAILQASE